jgi:hypothetical protein
MTVVSFDEGEKQYKGNEINIIDFSADDNELLLADL